MIIYSKYILTRAFIMSKDQLDSTRWAWGPHSED